MRMWSRQLGVSAGTAAEELPSRTVCMICKLVKLVPFTFPVRFKFVRGVAVGFGCNRGPYLVSFLALHKDLEEGLG